MNCFDCVSAKEIKGCHGSRWTPPEPDEAECTNLDVEQSAFDAVDFHDEYFYDTLAELCGCFEVIPAGKCRVCGAELSGALRGWKIWGGGYESVPVCSEKCKAEYERKINLEVEESIKHPYAYRGPLKQEPFYF